MKELRREDNLDKYALFLANIKGIGAVTIHKLIHECGSPLNIYQLSMQEVMNIRCLNEKQKEQFISVKSSWELDKAYQKLMERSINFTYWEQDKYPRRLRNIDNPPYLLYYYGNLPKEELPTIAIIGARMCSDYGKRSAEVFGRELAYRGIQVISGMASGVDSIAQRAAMDAGGSSFGILGNGVDICYPSSSGVIYDQMRHNGGIISEFAPGEKPEAFHFPMRNRIISGLADLVLVIEAKEKSGTAITVNMALEQGKDVYAVPGRIDDALSAGCNRLIRDGAGMACCVNDIMSGFGCFSESSEQEKKNRPSPSYTTEEKEILELLRIQAMTAEALYQKMTDSNQSIQELLSLLLMMQIKDYIDCQAGLYYVK